MQKGAPATWHHLAGEEALAALGSSLEGLSAAEAARRLREAGPNELPRAAGRSAIRRFLAQFDSILIYFLLVAAGAAALLGHVVDAAVILAVIIVNAVVASSRRGARKRRWTPSAT